MGENFEFSQGPKEPDIDVEARESIPEKKKDRLPIRPIIALLITEMFMAGVLAERKREEGDFINARIESSERELRPLTEMGPQIRHMFGKGPKYWIKRQIKGPLTAKVNFEGIRERYGFFKPRVAWPEAQPEQIPPEKRETEKAPAVAELKGELKVGGITLEQTLDRDKMGEIVTQTFPKNWVNNKIARVAQEKIGHMEQTNAKYGLAKGWYTVAENRQAASSEKDGNKRDIVFNTPGANKKGLNIYEMVTEILPHEIAHSNDWDRDDKMSLEERMKLLLSVGERLQAPDRYMSQYVESINASGKLDKQAENYQKATEYWAEICAQYFSHPARLSIRDFQLVDSRVRKTDQNFDLLKNKGKRDELSNYKFEVVKAGAQKAK